MKLGDLDDKASDDRIENVGVGRGDDFREYDALRRSFAVTIVVMIVVTKVGRSNGMC